MPDQTYFDYPNVYGVSYPRIWLTKVLRAPNTSSTPEDGAIGAIATNPEGTNFYIWNGTRWNSLPGAIYGIATPSTVPIDTTNYFVKYSVVTAGTYTNFLDNTGAAIIVTSGNLSSGIVELWGQNNVWQKQLIPLPDLAPLQAQLNVVSSMLQIDETGNINFCDSNGAIVVSIKKDGMVNLASLLMGKAQIQDDADNLIAFGDKNNAQAFAVRRWSELIVDKVTINKLNVSDNGTVKLPSSFNISGGLKQFVYGSATDYLLVLSYGQSNSVGAGSTIVMTTTQIYDSLMFGSVRPSSFAALVALIEGGAGFGETPLSGCIETFINNLATVDLLTYDKKVFKFIGAAPGVGGQTIQQLSKGDASGDYLNIINYTTGAKTYIDTLAKKISVPYMFWIQGESDTDIASNPPPTSYATYTALLNQLIIDVNTDIKSITGQANSVPLIGMQMCIHAGGDKGFVNKAQYDMMLSNPLFTLAASSYYALFEMDGAHYISEYDRYNGAYLGQAAFKWLTTGKPYPLYPRYTTVSGNDIIIKFNVPQTPLKFDATLVSQATDQGFEVYASGIDPYSTGSAKLTLSNITIISETEVKITCSASPAGGTLKYARQITDGWITGYNAASGTATGTSCQMLQARGNLRDSQGDKVVRYGFPLHNYCLAFVISL